MGTGAAGVLGRRGRLKPLAVNSGPPKLKYCSFSLDFRSSPVRGLQPPLLHGLMARSFPRELTSRRRAENCLRRGNELCQVATTTVLGARSHMSEPLPPPPLSPGRWRRTKTKITTEERVGVLCRCGGVTVRNCVFLREVITLSRRRWSQQDVSSVKLSRSDKDKARGLR